MKKRYVFFALLAAAQLVLVICNTFGIPMGFGSSRLAQAVAYSKNLTGADSGFAFFASPIAGEVRAIFRLTDHDGNVRVQPITWSNSSEVNDRLRNAVGSMANFQNIQGDVAASLAAVLFGKNPDVTTIEVLVDGQSLPSMQQYREGLRPEWLPIFRQTFKRTDIQPGNKTA